MADDDGEIINEKVRVKIGLDRKNLTCFRLLRRQVGYKSPMFCLVIDGHLIVN